MTYIPPVRWYDPAALTLRVVADVGGFAGTPTPELAARWHQFGSVCPIYRSHGTTPREPWAYGPEAEASIAKSIALRADLQAYRCVAIYI